MNKLAYGDYVLATKYKDGDPNDHWCVGFFNGVMGEYGEKYIRFDVVDSNGNSFRNNGFRRVEKISKERGKWLLENSECIQFSGKSLWYFKRIKI